MEDESQKIVAALGLALGMCRAMLVETLAGNPDMAEMNRVICITSTEYLARVLGCPEGEISVDWNDVFDKAQIAALKGYGP